MVAAEVAGFGQLAELRVRISLVVKRRGGGERVGS
jgi:hypothetical protein